MLKALLDRDDSVADTYVPMRQHFVVVGGQRVSRMALTMPGMVFVRGDKNRIFALLRDKSANSHLMTDSSREGRDAMVVPDSEMDAFRLFNDNTAGQLMLLRSPFSHFTAADRIRIMSGPFAGYEGYIREIGGDNKLIFKVGSMAIALSNIMRYDVAVVENHHAATESSMLLRIADRLTMRCEEAGIVDGAAARLRSIMADLGDCRRAADFPPTFSADDRADAASLARFVASDPSRLLRYVGDAPMRRFLTATVERGSLRHADFVEHRLPATIGADSFTAHVAELPDGTLRARWGEFAEAVCALTAAERRQLVDKCRRYGLTAFSDALCGSAGLRFDGIWLEGKCADPQAFADAGAAIVQEILSSVRARRWRTLLYAVCLR